MVDVHATMTSIRKAGPLTPPRVFRSFVLASFFSLAISSSGCEDESGSVEVTGRASQAVSKREGRQLSESEVAAVVRKAGFPERLVGTMVCIAKHESTYYERAVNDNVSRVTPGKVVSVDRGLFQINSIHVEGSSKNGYRALRGCPSDAAALWDAATNARCAYAVWNSQGLNAWVAYRDSAANRAECDRFPAPPLRSGEVANDEPSVPSDADDAEQGGDPEAGGCYSPSLGRSVGERVCVRSKSSGSFYQCMNEQWFSGGDGTNGPFAPCEPPASSPSKDPDDEPAEADDAADDGAPSASSQNDKTAGEEAAERCEEYDAIRGAALASAARSGVGGAGGKCYRFVKKHLEAAGIPITKRLPAQYAGSAYQFASWARSNPRELEALGLKKVAADFNDLPRGAILVWRPGQCGYHMTHGHIEVVTAKDTACSDFCGRIRMPGRMSGRPHCGRADIPDVYIPIKRAKAEEACSRGSHERDGGGAQGAQPQKDSCEGKSDGWYCSDLVEYSAYHCRGDQIESGWQCADGTACRKDASGRATLSGENPGCFGRK